MHRFRLLLFSVVSLTFFLPTPAPALALKGPTQLPTEHLEWPPSPNEKSTTRAIAFLQRFLLPTR